MHAPEVVAAPDAHRILSKHEANEATFWRTLTNVFVHHPDIGHWVCVSLTATRVLLYAPAPGAIGSDVPPCAEVCADRGVVAVLAVCRCGPCPMSLRRGGGPRGGEHTVP